MHVPDPWLMPVRAAVLAGVALLSSLPAHALQAADYQRAERVHDSHLRGALRNASVLPNWLADGRFWYEREDAQGRRHAVLVDPVQATRQILFEPAALDKAVASLGASGQHLRLANVQMQDDGLRLRFSGEAVIDCQWPRWQCARSQAASAPADALPSPSGDVWLQVRDNNLWLQHPGTAPRALTTRGEAGHGYGVLPDFTLRGIPRREGRMPARPFAVSWSPDGRYIAGIRYDERALQDYPYLESTPANSARPRVHTVKLGLLGDAQQVRDSLYVIDTRSGRQHDIALPEGWNTLSEAGVLGWDGGRLYTVIAHSGVPRRLRLMEIDADSGALRTVLEEASDTRLQLNVYSYNRPTVAILPGQDTALWFSQRDGWGHLYRVRLSDGKVLRQLTRGQWVVRDLLGVDSAAGWAYFSAGGVDGGDPYVRGLYRVSLQGGPVQRLAADGNDHLADAGTGALFGGRAPQALSPHGGYLVDTVSSLEQAPRTVLRASDDGREVMVLETADDSAIVAAGWRPPRRERLLAADGRTPIFATVYLPRDYRDDGHFPVVDAMYGGSFISNAPVTYAEAVSAPNRCHAPALPSSASWWSAWTRAAPVAATRHSMTAASCTAPMCSWTTTWPPCASWASVTVVSICSGSASTGIPSAATARHAPCCAIRRSTRWAWPRPAATTSRACTAVPCMAWTDCSVVCCRPRTGRRACRRRLPDSTMRRWPATCAVICCWSMASWTRMHLRH